MQIIFTYLQCMPNVPLMRGPSSIAEFYFQISFYIVVALLIVL